MGDTFVGESILTIEPPKVLALMDGKERARTVILLGLDGEPEGVAGMRLKLNVVFQPLPVRHGSRDWFIATTGGSATLSAIDAEVTEFTPPVRTAIEHVVSYEREVTGSGQLAPEVEARAMGGDFKVRPGSLQRGARNQLGSEMKFSTSEMPLVAMNFGNEVQWRIDSHRGEKAIRDFLVGNIPLEATFRWRSSKKAGSAAVRPSDISFFDNSKRMLSARASILMRYVLWKKGIKVANPDGIEVSFVERQNECPK